MTEQLQFGVTLTDRWAELDAKVAAALRSALLSEREKEVLRVIAGHRGAAQAIRAEEVARQAGMAWCERARREIAGVVETAVLLYRIPIGGLRMKPYGYFLIASAGDLDLAIHPLWGEVYAHLRRLRALTSKTDVARLFGQAMLQLDAEAGKPKEAA
ncbi:MAG: hypothetical protein LAN84_09750 [Acidobacteriia bacterium]|nr:hypothetical protein [Terriglobia bacterium]